MKKLLVFGLILFTGCTSATPHGECIGFNGEESPTLRYEYSGWNIGLGIIFFELIIPPIVVGLNDLKCPVGPRHQGGAGGIAIVHGNGSIAIGGAGGSGSEGGKGGKAFAAHPLSFTRDGEDGRPEK